MKTTETKAQTKTITVKTDEANPMDVTILADAIVAVSDAFEKLNSSRLTKRAIILLLHDLSKVNKGEIESILYYAPLLKKHFAKP